MSHNAKVVKTALKSGVARGSAAMKAGTERALAGAEAQPLLFTGALEAMPETFALQVVNNKGAAQERIERIGIANWASGTLPNGSPLKGLQRSSLIADVLVRHCGLPVDMANDKDNPRRRVVNVQVGRVIPGALVVHRVGGIAVNITNDGCNIVGTATTKGQPKTGPRADVIAILNTNKAITTKLDDLRAYGQKAGMVPKPEKREGKSGQGTSAAEVAAALEEKAGLSKIFLATRDSLKAATGKNGVADWRNEDWSLVEEIASLASKVLEASKPKV
jgi:hypothetical protein